MSFQKVKAYFKEQNMEDKVIELSDSSATVLLAAQALGCEPKRIAKTMSFYIEGKPVLIVTAGDAKVDNRKFKDTFHEKARMIPGAEVEEAVGHAPGGVCPFAVKEGVATWLDVSLKRFETVFPAAGSGHSAVELTLPELEQHAKAAGWVDVCKGWEQETA